MAVAFGGNSIVVEDNADQAAVAVAKIAGDGGVVVGSTEDLSDLIVKRRFVVTEQVALVGCIEIEEVVLYLGGTLSRGMLA